MWLGWGCAARASWEGRTIRKGRTKVRHSGERAGGARPGDGGAARLGSGE